MAERRIEIPPGQEVRISLPGGETLVLTCGAGNNNSNSNSSSGSEMPNNFVEAILGKRPRTKTRKGGKSKRGGSLNNNNGSNLENENNNNNYNGSNLENENNNNSNVHPVAQSFARRRIVNNGSNLENENNSNSNVGPFQSFGPRRTVKKGGKRGPNGYMKFAAEIRPQILKENPEMKSDVTKVARKIGEKWRALSAAEKAKY